jgi:hypothetical protein
MSVRAISVRELIERLEYCVEKGLLDNKDKVGVSSKLGSGLLQSMTPPHVMLDPDCEKVSYNVVFIKAANVE